MYLNYCKSVNQNTYQSVSIDVCTRRSQKGSLPRGFVSLLL
jgi:hypothetical protein